MKFKKGDSVKVKKDTVVEGFEDMDFTGWQGWVTEYFDSEDNDGVKEVNIEWDSITLKALPQEYIIRNIAEDFDFDSIILTEDTLEIANKRDKISDRIKVIKKIENDLEDDGFDDFEEDAFYIDLFESKKIEVNPTNLRKYLAYIKECIEMPCILTGIESMGTFAWEERFDFGMGTKEEYEAMRKTRPSYHDSFELISFLETEIESHKAIRVKVSRVSDKKQFVIGLDELKPEDEGSENYAILDPYVDWYVNH
jgi:hypothetical protein